MKTDKPHIYPTLSDTTKPIVIAHANAYHPDCYRKLVEHLSSDYSYHYLVQRPLISNDIPNNFGWKIFAEDLIEAIRSSHSGQAVTAIGHSMGAVACLWASILSPQLFKQLVLIDPVIMDRSKTWIRWVPFWITRRIIPIVKIAHRRRDRWDMEDDARSYLMTKKVFQRFDPDVFEEFVRTSIRQTTEGDYELTFPKRWEAAIYASAPHIWPLLSKITVPTHIIKAEYSNVISNDGWSKMKNRSRNMTFYEIPDSGHLVPFEEPLSLARHISTVIL